MMSRWAINPFLCWVALCPLKRPDPSPSEWNRIPPAAPKVLISLPIVARATASPSKTASPITELHWNTLLIKRAANYLFPLKKVQIKPFRGLNKRNSAGAVGDWKLRTSCLISSLVVMTKPRENINILSLCRARVHWKSHHSHSWKASSLSCGKLKGFS